MYFARYSLFVSSFIAINTFIFYRYSHLEQLSHCTLILIFFSVNCRRLLLFIFIYLFIFLFFYFVVLKLVCNCPCYKAIHLEIVVIVGIVHVHFLSKPGSLNMATLPPQAAGSKAVCLIYHKIVAVLKEYNMLIMLTQDQTGTSQR